MLSASPNLDSYYYQAPVQDWPRIGAAAGEPPREMRTDCALPIPVGANSLRRGDRGEARPTPGRTGRLSSESVIHEINRLRGDVWGVKTAGKPLTICLSLSKPLVSDPCGQFRICGRRPLTKVYRRVRFKAFCGEAYCLFLLFFDGGVEPSFLCGMDRIPCLCQPNFSWRLRR
jgi:hypothetical protein